MSSKIPQYFERMQHFERLRLTDPIEGDPALIWIVEPTHQRDDRRFATSTRPTAGEVELTDRSFTTCAAHTKATLVPGSMDKSTPLRTSTALRLG